MSVWSHHQLTFNISSWKQIIPLSEKFAGMNQDITYTITTHMKWICNNENLVLKEKQKAKGEKVKLVWK